MDMHDILQDATSEVVSMAVSADGATLATGYVTTHTSKAHK